MLLDLTSLHRRRLLGWLLAIYWIGLFVGTHVPLPPGAMPGNSDKAIHFLAYAGLACLLGLYRGTTRWRSSFAIIAVFAVIDEVLQIPVGRSCEAADMVADGLGAAAGGSLAWVLGRK